MNNSIGPSHNNVDLSTLSKEDLLRFITEQDRVIKAKNRENAELKIKAAAHDTTLAVIREQMENIRRTAAAVHGTDTYLANAPARI